MASPIPDTLMSDEEIDRLIAEWHDGDSPLPLHEYLGMTWDAYAAWVAGKPIATPLNDGEGLS